MEARVYAEDPFRNFLPSIGRLVRYQEPAASAHVRVDSGVGEGDEISMYYDPMIAKLIVSGETRDAAIRHMGEALDAYYIRGVSHNIPFLNAVISHQRFIDGDISTAFIDETYGDGFSLAHMAQKDPALFVSVAAVTRAIEARELPVTGSFVATIRDGESVGYEIEPNQAVQADSAGKGAHWVIRMAGATHHIVMDWRPGAPLCLGRLNGAPFCVQLDRAGEWRRLGHGGRQADILILSERGAALNRLMLRKEPPDLSRFLLSPMPGLLVQLAVSVGDTVKAGQTLAVVEAMKMENILRAEQDGVVQTVHAAEGESLSVDQSILEFE
ncbi:MAG: biotin/lipoyl-binding protein [Alphaproteobacteria bacterium]|nr:biotin/lipoyl-binding protein [Alphaproteobacteria bacterium]